MGGVYTNYESGANGLYDVIVGHKVSGDAEAPTGMVAVDIPEEGYQCFTSAKGAMPGVVIDTWKQIWGNSDIRRSYVADYELYDHRAKDPSNAQVDVFIHTGVSAGTNLRLYVKTSTR